jgi:hypothetical protein
MVLSNLHSQMNKEAKTPAPNLSTSFQKDEKAPSVVSVLDV